MGSKKRKAGRPAQPKTAPEPSKFDIEERFEDSEDDFQTGRDQILLEEGPEAKRRRRVAEEEELIQPSDEEILGYESADEDDDLEDSEEEDDEYDDMGQPKGGAESEEEEEGIAAWGSSKKDLYNADQIETEVDALEEEQEAKRLQMKQLQAMNEADFGFDESEWVESGKGTEDGADAGVVTEVLPQLEITEDMDTDEKLKILKSRYPEFEPLAKDFVELQNTFKDLQQAASKASSTDDDSEEPQPSPVPVVKFRALSAYLGTISMYFMLLSSPSPDATSEHVPMTPAELRQHPVMGSLVKFRKLWNTVKDLEELEEPAEETTKETKTEAKADKQPKTQETKKPKQKKLSKAEIAQAEAEALRAERLRQTEAGLVDLENLATEPSRKRKTQKIKAPLKDDDSDFGDEDALTAHEAEEKAKQKRSLRFYTSQLAQKANKRNAAGRDAGGDADLPYRERLRDRQARLNVEAEKRGRKELNADQQLGGDSDDEDRRVAKELRRGEGTKEGTDDDEYYDMVASRSKKRKDDKQARADAHAEAERLGGKVYEQEEVGPDGKRAITYQIQKNKGLHAKRSKDSRNPRVKKRKKYEEKKKKLGSTKQLYKGGEGRGGYGGELTGIKKNLVKSVKL